MAKKRQFSMMSDMMKRSNQGLKTIAMARARTGWFTPRNPSARWGSRSCDAVRRGGLRAGRVSLSSREMSRARERAMTSAARGTNRRREKGGARDGCASPLGQRPNHDACPAARVPLHASSSIATRRGWETRVSRAPRVPRARISKAGTTRSIGSSAPRPSNTPACPVRFPPAAGRWTSVADAHSWRPAKKFSRGPQPPDGETPMDDQTETFGPGSPIQPRLPSPRVRRPTPRPLSDRRAQ